MRRDIEPPRGPRNRDPMQVACDSHCINGEGVNEAATIWIALARLLRVPLQETHAALLLMSSNLRARYPLEYFTLKRPGEEPLQTTVGSAVHGMDTWDLFLAIRIHTARIGAAANELRQLLDGDSGNIARLSGVSGRKMHIFAIAEKRTPGQVTTTDSLEAGYKMQGLNWNEKPSSSSYAGSGNSPAPSPSASADYDSYAPAPPPPPAPLPTTTVPAPAPVQECGNGCLAHMIGDGRCDTVCQSWECIWDGGDCAADAVTSNAGGDANQNDQDNNLPGCGCQSRWLGNGICETFCNYEACNFDGGDCASSPAATAAPLVPRPAPAPPPPATTAAPVCGCNAKWVGDGICDAYCNTPGCDYDGGDCPRPWNAPPAPATPSPAPAPRPVVRATTPAPMVPAPHPAPQAPMPAAPSPVGLRGASTSGEKPEEENTQVVDFSLQGGSQGDSAYDDSWRIVATTDTGATFFPDASAKKEEDTSSFVTAAIIAIFFAAAGLVAVTAICIVTRRQEPKRRQPCIVPPKVFMDSCSFTPNPLGEGSQQTPYSHRPSAKKSKVSIHPTIPGRQESKQSVDSVSTTSTDTPHSHGTSHSLRSSDNEDWRTPRRREKEVKVHPEPEQPSPPPMPQTQRQSRGSKESVQPAPPPMPDMLRNNSKQSQAKDTPSAATPQARRASEPVAASHARQSSHPTSPTASTHAAPVSRSSEPKARSAQSQGPRSAAQADNHAGSEWFSSPHQPREDADRSKAKADPTKAATSGKFGAWPFGRGSAATASAEGKSKAKPHRSQSCPPSSSTKSSWFGSGAPSPSAAEKATQKKANCLSTDMMNQLENAKSKTVEERKKVFKDLQRQLHPDKNIHQAEAAKLAFQKLMEQRSSFLAS